MDREAIEAWWKKWPTAGIGIATGKESDLSILDVDDLVALGKLQAGNPMPQTWVVETGGGGLHYYFQYNPNIKSVSAFGSVKGLDTRSDGGYIVAPPSPHTSGKPYRWKSSDVEELPVWPDWAMPKASEEKADRGRPRVEKFNPLDPRQVARLKHALSFVSPEDYDRWIKICIAIGRAFSQNESGFELVSEWSAGAGKNYDAKKTRDLYHRQSREPFTGKQVTIASVYTWAAEHPDFRPLPEKSWAHLIYDDPRAEHETIEAVAAPAADAPNVFVRDSALWRVIRYSPDEGGDGAIRREQGSYITRQHDSGTLLREISPITAWFNDTSQGYVQGRISRIILNEFLKSGSWPSLKHLRAFVSHPTVREDGSLITREGWDAASKLFLTEEVKLKLPPEGADSEKLLATLMEPFEEYRWASASDRSVFLAALFTVGLRHLFPTVPLFVFAAPSAGSGKTMLVDCISLLWFNTIVPKASYIPDSDEMEKRIATFLNDGDRMICFDNVPEGLYVDDPKLNAVLTSPRHKFRVLGKSESIDIENSSTFFMTGNAIRIVGDLARRSMQCLIDPETENPALRSFKIKSLKTHIRQHRPALLSAALRLILQYMKRSEKPSDGEEMGSFEEWFAFMRGMLLWLGEADLKDALINSLEENEEATYQRTFASSVFINFLRTEIDKPFGIQELVREIQTNRELRADFVAYYSGVGGVYGTLEPNHRTVGGAMVRLNRKVFRLESGLRIRFVRNAKTSRYVAVEVKGK